MIGAGRRWWSALASALLLGVAFLPPKDVVIMATCPWTDAALQQQTGQIARAIWSSNITRDTAIVHPSKAYAGVWLRDSFWTLAALGDQSLAAQALAHFTAAQRPSGQVPTQFSYFVAQPIYRADESTLLYLIWAYWQVKAGGERPPRQALDRALHYALAAAKDGWYTSRAGSYADWFDSFRLPAPDTLSYNQGLYAVALQAAAALGLSVSPADLATAIAHYRTLADPQGGYLRFSRTLAYHDISGLTGEYLSLWLFRHPLLPDVVVRRTIDTQPSFRGGFKVVVDARGHFLAPHSFTVHLIPGDYQNGASWLLYDYMALATGYLHHESGIAARMHARLVAEFRTGPTFHEYLDTNPSAASYGSEPAYRDGFSWDTFVTAVNAALAPACGE
jgi:hypothetical protein